MYLPPSYTVLYSAPVDLLAAAADYVIAIPPGRTFVPDEAGLIVTALTGAITTQPTVRFGTGTGTEASLLAAVVTTALLAVGDRERFATLLSNSQVSQLSVGVTVSATGPSVYAARAYVRGFLR